MKKLLTVVSALLLGLAVAAPAQAAKDAPGRPDVFRGHFYHVVNEPLTWHEAVAYCEQDGGNLVTINSAEEDQFVYNLAPYGWLGASDEAVEGTWVWVTGEPFSYTNWAPYEPNNLDGVEHYLSYWGDEYPGQWNDMPTSVQTFVCEYEPPHRPRR